MKLEAATGRRGQYRKQIYDYDVRDKAQKPTGKSGRLLPVGESTGKDGFLCR
jgi:hypothetical protein